MNILLVDDDEVIRMGMRKLIERSGHDWTVSGEVADGAMALELLDSRQDVDLIICDVRMPIMDGLELTEIIRNKRAYDPKIIMLSGFGDFEYVRSAFMNGACDYILKPFKKAEFIALIEKIEGQILAEKKSRQTESVNKEFLISEVLRTLSKATPQEAAAGLQRLEGLGVQVKDRDFATIRITPDQYYRQFTQQSQYDKELADVESRLLKFLDSQSKELSVIHTVLTQEILLLVFSDGPGEAISSFAKALFHELGSGENTVTVGFSNIYVRPEELPVSFEESRQAAMARFYLGQKQLIDYASVEGKAMDINYDIAPAVASLVHYITLCDYMGAREVMDRVFFDLSYCPSDRFRRYMHDIIDTLSLRLEAFGSYIEGTAQETGYYVDYLNTYRELKTFMSSLLKNVIDYISAEKDKKSEKRIEMAKDYIAEHYSEPMTLGDIADYVELNPSYFSNLFKTETGINFSEYLLNIRMDKAKELLRDPKIRIYEIGSLVGYDDAVSFGRAFKKKWGISPKEYRQLVY